MSKIRLFGTSSGYVEIAPAAAASNNTLTAPSTVGEIIAKDAAGAIGVTSIVTTTATITTAKVGAAVTITESGIEASGIGITCVNINGGQVGGRRNIIINGDQKIAQRGTTAKLATTSATYKCVDRWKTDIDGSGGGDFYHAQTGYGTSISADVPTGQGFDYSSKITVNTSASQPSGTSNRHQFYTQIEKQDVYHLEWGTSTAKTCTLSFWVKSSVTGTHIAYIRHYGGTTQSYYTNYTINSANTWEKKVITLTGPTSGGNVVGTTDNGILIEFTLGVSSGNETGTLREWTDSGTIRAASGSVYLPENAGATWYITGIQFEVGSQATPFEHRSFGDELALCQRYYCHTYSYGVYPGANYNNTSTARQGMIFSYRQRDNNYQAFSWSMPVAMRAVPTQTMYSMVGTAGKASGSVTDYDINTNSPHNGSSGVMAYGTNTIADDGYVHFVLDAEL